MLSFHSPAVGREVPSDGAKSLTFNLVVLVLTAVLMTASLWFASGNGSTTGIGSEEQAQKQSIEAAKLDAPAQPGRAS